MRTFYVRAAFCASVAFFGCGKAAPQPVTVEMRDAQALRLIRGEFHRIAENNGPGALMALRPDEIDFRTERSQAIPSLTYWWGGYFFPKEVVPNLEAGAVAARTTGGAFLLRVPSDWFLAARSAGWRPTAATNVLRGCTEAVRTTKSHGNSMLYKGADDLRAAGHSRWLPVERLLASRRLTDPTSAGDSIHGFVADFWMFEIGMAVRFRCSVKPSRFELVETDTILGGGFPGLL